MERKKPYDSLPSTLGLIMNKQLYIRNYKKSYKTLLFF